MRRFRRQTRRTFRRTRRIGAHVLERQCDCAERTGELVVFTCPCCMEEALLHLQALTTRGISINLDESGSVSASIGSGGTLG